MAKKTVATLQTGTKNYTKVIKMVKAGKNGSYSFRETVLHNDQVKDWFAKP